MKDLKELIKLSSEYIKFSKLVNKKKAADEQISKCNLLRDFFIYKKTNMVITDLMKIIYLT
jgi:hypothetical protein